MKPPKKYYSKEYKLKAVSLCKQRGNSSLVAKELGLRPDMLSRWKREYSQDQERAFLGFGNARRKKESNELFTLKKQLREVELERDILKKAVGIFSKNDRAAINL